MRTRIASKTREVVISPENPFVVIGERINPTRRKKLMETMAAGDFSVALEDARAQVAAGAQVLDLNAGIPDADEPAILADLVRAVMEAVDVPLCFDSANVDALAAALAVYPGKALINSTTAEEHMLAAVLPLVAKHGAAVIGVITDDGGVPVTPEERLAAARKLVGRAADYGIPAEDVIIDALSIAVSADPNAGRITLDTLRLIEQDLGVNLSLGASNVSFGLPERRPINATYLALCIARGLTTAITDPTVPEISTTLRASDLLMGHDPYARRWLKAYRAAKAGPTAARITLAKD